jgi:hypothetical protein
MHALGALQSPHAIDPTVAGVLESMTEVKPGVWLSNIKTRPAKNAADKLAALRLEWAAAPRCGAGKP